MKIILINPISTVAKKDMVFRRFLTPLPPQGIAYVGAMLEKNGNEVILIDQHGAHLDNKEVINRICKESPQIVGFSCLTPVMGNVKILVDELRKLNKEVLIVLGNIHPTIFADEILKEGIADAIIRGEGEHTMLELVSALKYGKDLKYVNGISFRENGTIFHNPDVEPIGNLDELPYPAWHLLDLGYYKEIPLASLYNTITLPLQASRGCPFNCIFCAQEKIYKKPRYRQVKNVVDEIAYMNETLRATAFGFNDAYFPFSKKHGFEFCDELIKRGLNKKIKWGTELRVDMVDFELLKKMKEAGAHLIMYGFEVGNQRVLHSIGKNATIGQAIKAMKDTKRAGILTLGLFMLGLPGETKIECEETIRLAKLLDCDFVKFNITVPYPGSILFERYKDLMLTKLNEPEKFTSWYDWSSFKPDLVFMPLGLSSKELVYLQRKAMFEFYMRPKVILKHLFRGTISLKNLFFGGIILISRFFKISFKK